MSDPELSEYFLLFTEIGILEQLSRVRLEACLPAGFVQPQFVVLNHLARIGGGQTPGALARIFQVPKTSMTHSLSILERHGLIERAPHPTDRRSALIHLTDRGQQFRAEVLKQLARDMARLALSFPVEKITRLRAELEDLRRFLDQDRTAIPMQDE
ncbi:MAG: winged helix DNA-binding protein [Rhodobacteraceae bacterium]|nr:winged helix DNA-binding protein [Paracoccaceae bacterium]MCC5966629.1 winged helix DNA-binding protein [Natronohydrobacter sp.]